MLKTAFHKVEVLIRYSLKYFGLLLGPSDLRDKILINQMNLILRINSNYRIKRNKQACIEKQNMCKVDYKLRTRNDKVRGNLSISVY